MCQKRNRDNWNNGMTLVTLIIMVIIMIILAGITYSILTRSGIIDKAMFSKESVLDQMNEAEKQLANITDEEKSGGYVPGGDGSEESEGTQTKMELIVSPNGGEWGLEKGNDTWFILTQEEIADGKNTREIEDPTKTPVYEIKFDTGVENYTIDSEYVDTTFSKWEKEYGKGSIAQKNGKWTFTYGEGTTKINAQYTGKNITIKAPQDRFGYTFTGWCENADGTGDILAAGTTYTANKNVTLYAIWAPKLVTVYFYPGPNATID